MVSQWRLLNPGAAERSSDGFLKIAAALFRVPPELLPTLREEEARRSGRIRLIATGTALAVTVVLAGALAWAVVERGNAVRNYEAARNSVDRLVRVVAEGLRDVPDVSVDTIDSALRQVEGLVDGLAKTNPDDPLLNRSKANMLYEFAKTYQVGHDPGVARRKAEDSLRLRQELVDRLPNVPELWAELAESIDLRGDLQRSEKRWGEARATFRRAHDSRSRLVRDVPVHIDRPKWLLGLSKSHVRLGDTDMDEDRANNRSQGEVQTRPLVQSAAVHYRESLGHSARLYLADPKDPVWRRELSWSLNKDGDFKAHLRLWKPAIASYEHALCLRRGLNSEYPLNTKWESDVSWTLQKMAAARLGDDDGFGAEINLFEMVSIRQRLVPRKAGDRVLVHELALGYLQLADYHRRIRQPDVVVALLATIAELADRLKGADGVVSQRLTLPSTATLEAWARSQLPMEKVDEIRVRPSSIMNVSIYSKTTALSSGGYQYQCLEKVEAALKALPPPEPPS
jgi:hypothetical protein